MKFAVTGSRKDKGKIAQRIKSLGFLIRRKSPDFVVTYGGDGSILYAERAYPGVPKITIRASSAGLKCLYTEADLEKVIEKIKSKEYSVKEEMKLEAEYKGKSYIALNEIQLHNKSPVKAVRFSIYVNGLPLFENIVGDGAVIATPFGSTAYFSSVGGKDFEQGVGIALNNPHNFAGKRYTIVDAASEISIKILRDEGILLSDNSNKSISVKEGESIRMRAAKEPARFVVVKWCKCQNALYI